MADSLVIAAPCSGSGKTVVTLALLRAIAQQGTRVASAKVGPDYIDPHFHRLASGRSCYNVDLWAMRPQTLQSHVAKLGDGADLIIVEGVMGLFDGPEQGKGSTADVAAELQMPVIMVVDCSHQSQSIAALVKGFRDFRDDVNVAGVILNRVSSPRHVQLLRSALEQHGIRILGALPRVDDLSLPSRHLGLVQASEHTDLEAFLDRAGQIVYDHMDLDAFRSVAQPLSHGSDSDGGLPPLGNRIAIASDDAFSFAYPHVLEGWRAAGAELIRFSPLANEGPDGTADAVFLPGGYPELHAGTLSGNTEFLTGLRNAARRDALIYGECGGYMVLGDYIVDANGERHAMSGLLPIGTSFATRKLQLGYRQMRHDGALPLPRDLKGHEFHYCSVDWRGDGDALFETRDTAGNSKGDTGMRHGTVMGSYTHIIDAAG